MNNVYGFNYYSIDGALSQCISFGGGNVEIRAVVIGGEYIGLKFKEGDNVQYFSFDKVESIDTLIRLLNACKKGLLEGVNE